MGDPEKPRPFYDCYIGSDPWESTYALYDSRYVKRATAISRTASEYGIDFKGARCETTYARWLSLQEIWDGGAGERWWDNQGEFVDGKWVSADDDGTGPYPENPVEGWEPDPERDATFELCGKDAPGAVKVWKVATGLD